MTDMDRIRKIEERLGFSFKQVPIEKIRIDALYADPDSRTFSANEEVGLTGLSLDCRLVLLNIEVIDLISEFHELRFLSLCNCRSTNLNFIKLFKNLLSLNLSSCNLTDVSYLEELKGLTTLNLSFNELTDISFLAELKGLTSLNFSFNNLTDASFLVELKCLKSLSLSNNNLTDLSFLAELKGLTALSLNFNNLPDVSFLAELKSLTALDLCGTNLPDVSFLAELKSLTTLNLSSIKLSDVSFLAELKSLITLNLSSTKLSDVSFLAELKSLINLDLSNNNLPDLSFLTELKCLTSLYLIGTNLTDAPFLSELKSLTTLDLSENNLTDVSFLAELKSLTTLDLAINNLTNVLFLSELKSLTTLDLSVNNLTDVSFLAELKCLTTLDLSVNNLTDVSFLAELKYLTTLDLSSNNLTDVSFLAELKYLTTLDLSGNNLTDVSFLAELKYLTILDLNGNNLTELLFLKELGNLISINLRGNNIVEIPEWLAERYIEISIEEVYFGNNICLYGNPITNPPLEIVKQGRDAILNYYRQIKMQGIDYLYEAKLLIVGEGESGKTTLACKIENSECPLPHIDDRTKGITITPHQFDTISRESSGLRKFRLNVWDFGGQEMYHATHRFFLSKRSLYVLVADNRKDDTDFNYWLNIIELFAGECSILIVLNEKGDVQRSINNSEIKSRYPKSIKEIISVNFKTCEEKDLSNREQRVKRINELKRYIELYASKLPHIGEPLPARWIEIRQSIEGDNRNAIYREQFEELCAKKGFSNQGDIDTLLGYFHDLGVVLHFCDCVRLRDRVILKPFWATAAVYRIFDNAQIKERQGRFSRNDCADIWVEREYHGLCDMLVELMKNFQLVYEIESSGKLVAPQLLPENTPSYDWPVIDKSTMQFHYDYFMPKGIIWQFIIVMYRYIKDHNLVWRNGVVLSRGEARAVVTENIQRRRVYISFTGTGFIELRAIITDALESINKAFHGLTCDIMIPCDCVECEKSKNPSYFKYSDLARRRDKGKKTIECGISFQDVLVLQLLDGFDSPQLKEELRKGTPPDTNKTIRIFLASSSELKEDRNEFEIFINRQNKWLNERGIFLHLEIWEDFIDSMSQTRLQDEYNKTIKQCDIFIMLYFTKVGMHTKDEFEIAFNTFKETNRPRIYTYCKNAHIKTGSLNSDDVNSLFSFKKRLKDLGHYETEYSDINDLKYKFGEQLKNVLPTLFDNQSEEENKLEYLEYNEFEKV